MRCAIGIVFALATAISPAQDDQIPSANPAPPVTAQPALPEGYTLEDKKPTDGNTESAVRTPADELMESVLQEIEKCKANGGSPVTCFVNSSPARCKHEAIAYLADHDMNRRLWVLCVQSCGDANLYSRTLGECSW